MAGRPEKYTVSYFPHYTKDSKTLFIIENKFGAEGYMFWYKLLEFLCNQNGLYYDCKENGSFDYLSAKTRLSSEKAMEILTKKPTSTYNWEEELTKKFPEEKDSLQFNPEERKPEDDEN